MSVRIPAALTIAGSDSGGGAGIQADLKTFAALGVHGASAITCVTAQNPDTLLKIEPVSPKALSRQIEAVLASFPIRAIKTGMLYSKRLIQAVAASLEGNIGRKRPLVVDPVMVSASGSRLLRKDALATIQARLFPMATLLTPNLAEAACLLGKELFEPEDLRMAARDLRKMFGVAVLVKGGHLPRATEAIDIYYDGKTELLLRAPFVKGVKTHGTGCAYSAAIAGYLALGCDLPRAVQFGKEYITQAIAQAQWSGRHLVLNHSWGAPYLPLHRPEPRKIS